MQIPRQREREERGGGVAFNFLRFNAIRSSQSCQLKQIFADRVLQGVQHPRPGSSIETRANPGLSYLRVDRSLPIIN